MSMLIFSPTLDIVPYFDCCCKAKTRKCFTTTCLIYAKVLPAKLAKNLSLKPSLPRSSILAMSMSFLQPYYYTFSCISLNSPNATFATSPVFNIFIVLLITLIPPVTLFLNLYYIFIYNALFTAFLETKSS